MPSEPPNPDPTLRERVEQVLGALRERLHLDGADLALEEISADGVVSLRFTGRQARCSLAMATLQAGIEHALRERVPEVCRVVTRR